jgi:hypothetical protein
LFCNINNILLSRRDRTNPPAHPKRIPRRLRNSPAHPKACATFLSDEDFPLA